MKDVESLKFVAAKIVKKEKVVWFTV